MVPTTAILREDYTTRRRLEADVAAVGGHVLKAAWEAYAMDEALAIAVQHGYIAVLDTLGRGTATYGRTAHEGLPVAADGTVCRVPLD